MSVDWVGFGVASVAIVLAPGPGSMFVARTAATRRVQAGFMAMLGIMVGDACLIFLSLVGVSALFLAHPSVFHAIRLAGAGYLIFLGIQSLLARSKNEADALEGSSVPFRQAVAVTLLNPKAVFFFMAFFPVFITSAEDGLAVPYAMMTLLFMGISAAYLSFLIHASSKLAMALQQSRTLRSVARKLCGCVFIGFGLKTAMSGGGILAQKLHI
jgi:leucine efflux protein